MSEMKRELRIGNRVEYNGYECIIYSIVNDYPDQPAYVTLMIDGLIDVPITEITPIPITEDWLLKMGFEEVYKSSMHSTYYIPSLSYYFWYDKGIQYVDFQGTRIECVYIHQLQNIRFALTGEELTIK